MSFLRSKVLQALIIWSMLTWSVSAATIDSISAIDNNTVEIVASEDVIFSDINVEWDIKLLKDIPVSFSALDTEDSKKILINLWSDLTSETSYSLISILWAEGNIDFTIWEYLEGEINNENLLDDEDWITKINVVDSRTIELYFSEDLTDDTFEFKILSEIATDALNSEWNNKLSLEISKTLDPSTSYIVMILILEDANGIQILFDEDLHDFMTPATLKLDVPQENQDIAQVEKDEPEIIEEWNIEEVALNSAETPETWTATWILIIFAVLINLAIFSRKKFSK